MRRVSSPPRGVRGGGVIDHAGPRVEEVTRAVRRGRIGCRECPACLGCGCRWWRCGRGGLWGCRDRRWWGGEGPASLGCGVGPAWFRGGEGTAWFRGGEGRRRVRGVGRCPGRGSVAHSGVGERAASGRLGGGCGRWRWGVSGPRGRGDRRFRGRDRPTSAGGGLGRPSSCPGRHGRVMVVGRECSTSSRGGCGGVGGECLAFFRGGCGGVGGECLAFFRGGCGGVGGERSASSRRGCAGADR